MPDALFTAAGRPILLVRDVDAYTAQPEQLFTAGGSLIVPVRQYARAGSVPEVAFTPSRLPIQFVYDVIGSGMPSPEPARTPGGHSLMYVRTGDGNDFTPGGNPVRVVQYCDDAGLPVGFGVPTVYTFMGGSLPPGATLARASAGWVFNSSAVLQSVAANGARFSYDPATAALQGLLVEPAGTNQTPNGNMAGAAAGTPGTLPTGWIAATPAGATRQIVGTGTEDGIPYIDVRYSGTLSAATAWTFESSARNLVAVTPSVTPCHASSFCRLIAGALPSGVSLFTKANLYTSGGGGAGGNPTQITPTNAALRTQRAMSAVTASGTAAFCQQLWTFVGHIIGTVVDITLRLGAPEIDNTQIAATSPILTTGAAVSRAADVLTLAQAAGTYTRVDIARLSGTTTLGSVVVPGGGYVVPTDPSPLQSVTFTP